MSLSFETIMNASMTRKKLTDIICLIKFCKCDFKENYIL